MTAGAQSLRKRGLTGSSRTLTATGYEAEKVVRNRAVERYFNLPKNKSQQLGATQRGLALVYVCF